MILSSVRSRTTWNIPHGVEIGGCKNTVAQPLALINNVREGRNVNTTTYRTIDVFSEAVCNLESTHNTRLQAPVKTETSLLLVPPPSTPFFRSLKFSVKAQRRPIALSFWRPQTGGYGILNRHN